MPDTMSDVSSPRGAWSAAGAVAGVAGLAVSHAATMALTLRSSPLVGVAEAIAQLLPAVVADRAIEILGSRDKPVLVLIVALVMLAFTMYAGRLAERAWWKPVVLFALMGGIALVAVLTRFDAQRLDAVPVLAGTVTWIVVLSFLTDMLHRAESEPGTADAGRSRRHFMVASGVFVLASIGVGIVGSRFGARRRHVDQSRRLLNLPVSAPEPVPEVRVGLADMPPWQTPNVDFYQVHTAIVVPTIEPQQWSLRIHGMVDNEINLSYQELIDRPIIQAWVTLNCVSNPVGGDLIGNAWWSGVPLADLLAEAGVDPSADAVLQTSHDGWTCGTPLSALRDRERQAMLAIAMNGEPLPIDHGFPVRTLVPGLYGYVSACKWVVDLEVSRFADIEAFWTEKGWAEKAPVKVASRIDVPADGDELEGERATVGGYAWAQDVGIAAVEIAVDGGAWFEVELGQVPNEDTWVQWKGEIMVPEGDHEVRVRAITRDGEVQTGVEADVRPDGATGWHAVEFSTSLP